MKSIFVSSTFRDMQAERDMLHLEVIPRLQEKAREYGERISFTDLRWGAIPGMFADGSCCHGGRPCLKLLGLKVVRTLT
jgi:hypothetical protein